MNLDLDRSAWKRVAFGDVIHNVNESVRDAESAGIDRIVAMEHLDPGELKIERWGSTSNGTTFTRRVKPGQTLFGKRRAYQRKVAYAEFSAICSGDIYTFEADETRMLGQFLPFLVQSNAFFHHALGTSAGSLSPRTNWRDLKDFEFDLPPFDEQKRIADLLWAVEIARSANAVLSREVTMTTTAIFESAASGTSTSALNSWVSRIDAGRSPRAAAEPAKDDQLGVLRVSAVGRDVFVASENKRLLDPADFRSRSIVRAGDVLVTRANAVVDNVARPCMVDRDYPNLMLSDKTLRLVPNHGYPGRVLLAALNSPAYRAYVREAVNGTEAKNISQTKILAGPVPSMDTEAVAVLSSQLAACDEAARATSKVETQLRQLKLSLLAEVFGGN